MLGKEKRRAERAKSFFSPSSPFMCSWPFLPFIQEERRIGGKKLSFLYMCENGCRGHFLLLKTFFCTFVYVGWRDGVGGIFWQTFFLPCLRSLGRREKDPIFCRKTHCHVWTFQPSSLSPFQPPKAPTTTAFKNFWAPQKDFIFSEICGLYITVQNVVHLHILFWSVIRVNVYCPLREEETTNSQFSWGKVEMPQRKSWHFLPAGSPLPHISGHFY